MWQLPADVPKLLLGSAIRDFPGSVGLLAAASGTAHVGIKTSRLFVERWAENDPRAYRDAMQAIVGWSVTDRLSTIQCPTLVIAADQDYTPVAVKEAYVARMPRAELVVIGDSRHATPVEQPEQFNEALMAFLSRQA